MKITMEASGETQRTMQSNNGGNFCTWDPEKHKSRLEFNVDPSMDTGARIKVEVYDAEAIAKDRLIGSSSDITVWQCVREFGERNVMSINIKDNAGALAGIVDFEIHFRRHGASETLVAKAEPQPYAFVPQPWEITEFDGGHLCVNVLRCNRSLGESTPFPQVRVTLFPTEERHVSGLHQMMKFDFTGKKMSSSGTMGGLPASVDFAHSFIIVELMSGSNSSNPIGGAVFRIGNYLRAPGKEFIASAKILDHGKRVLGTFDIMLQYFAPFIESSLHGSIAARPAQDIRIPIIRVNPMSCSVQSVGKRKYRVRTELYPWSEVHTCSLDDCSSNELDFVFHPIEQHWPRLRFWVMEENACVGFGEYVIQEELMDAAGNWCRHRVELFSKDGRSVGELKFRVAYGSRKLTNKSHRSVTSSGSQRIKVCMLRGSGLSLGRRPQIKVSIDGTEQSYTTHPTGSSHENRHHMECRRRWDISNIPCA